MVATVPRTSVLGYVQVAPTGLDLQIQVLTQTRKGWESIPKSIGAP